MKLLLQILLCTVLSNSTFAITQYVTSTGSGTQDGSTWADAAPNNSLQTIIDASSAGDQVWVACGTYATTTTTDRSISFNMKNGVAIYGGFAGNETDLSQRVFSCGPCSILSGDIGAAGNTDNSYKVVSNELLDSTAILDGFVISGGNDDRTPSNSGNGLGGGIYNHGFGAAGFCHPTIRNCILTDNFASWGAGAFNNGYNNGTTEPTYINCVFHQNHAYIEAGGMDSYGVGGNASPTIINSIFYGNTSATNVGAMYAWGGNTGGNSHPVLINCVFANNTAMNGYGGAFIAENLDENETTSSGSCTVTLQNCAVWNNTATGEGQQFYIRGTGAEVIATYSNIDLTGQNAPHVISGSGTGNLNTNPQFVDLLNAIGADAGWLTADDGLQLQNSSPLINSGNATGAPTTDILGLAHVGIPDVGAYENQAALKITENQIGDFDLYPNPTTDKLTIDFQDNSEHRIELYNVYGKVIQSEIVNGLQVLNVSDLPNGLYLILIDGSQTKKFIKE